MEEENNLAPGRVSALVETSADCRAELDPEKGAIILYVDLLQTGPGDVKDNGICRLSGVCKVTGLDKNNKLHFVLK